MKEKNMYYCALCGKSYESVDERAKCESQCIQLRDKEAKAKKEQEYQTKKRDSAKQIEAELAKINDMIKKHLEEYEYININSNNYFYLDYMFRNSLPFSFF